MKDLDPEALASQLRSPHGDHAKAVGEFMSKGNKRLYALSFRRLTGNPIGSVLEVGCGNGWYMDRFLALGNATTYQGLDLSEEMVSDAQERIKALGKTNLANVQQGDILHWQSDVQYDLVIAMNLIYFFPEPSELIKRLSGFLKPGGQLLLGFRTAGSMQQLPFASFGFRLFEPNEVEDLFKGTGLTSIDTQLEREELETPAGTFSLVNAVVSGIRPSVRALD